MERAAGSARTQGDPRRGVWRSCRGAHDARGELSETPANYFWASEYDGLGIDRHHAVGVRNRVSAVRGLGGYIAMERGDELFGELVLGQGRNAIEGNGVAVGSRAVLRRAVEFAVGKKRHARGPARANVRLDGICNVRLPRPQKVRRVIEKEIEARIARFVRAEKPPESVVPYDRVIAGCDAFDQRRDALPPVGGLDSAIECNAAVLRAFGNHIPCAVVLEHVRI